MADDAAFRLAYDEAVRALGTQADALNGLRQRAGTVLATTLVVTSFFGGQALARNATPSSAGWLAVAAFLAAGFLSIAVLVPTDLEFSTDVAAVVALIERAGTKREPFRELALMLSSQHDANSRRISRLQWIFRAGALMVLAEALLWIVFLTGS
jgi:hypothetical protein